MEKAGFGSRFIDWFLDGIFIGILAFVLSLVVGLIAGIAGSTDSGLLGLLSAALFFFLMFVSGDEARQDSQAIDADGRTHTGTAPG